MNRYTLLEDCEVWPEEANGQPTLVVNSVGGSKNRRPGLAMLLKELAGLPASVESRTPDLPREKSGRGARILVTF